MTSSEPGSPGPQPPAAVRFPPRSELPPGVVIQRLPALGTSWYERRFSYWARRTGGLLLLLAGAAIYIAIISGPIRAAGPPGSPGFLAALAAEIVFSLLTGVLIFRHLWRLGISGQSVRSSPSRNGRRGAGLGMLASTVGGSVGAFLLVVGALVSGGIVLAAIAIWSVPVPPTEQWARRQLAETLRRHQPAGHQPERRGGEH